MASDTMVVKLNVKFDKQMVTSGITYNYTTDPTITNIDPKCILSVAIGYNDKSQLKTVHRFTLEGDSVDEEN
ncbi:hypothetical protein CHS0354_008979 [Potamilus streckersoni]|uniref:Uncharacterized protein n=1 Tax=Potamilus streckersoni TaxID=2493646 RepID=A0AAE0WCS2_9BIVA|nr:hypothetical protein CHS0354_008979 [Potamilus streckersoni]